MSRSRIDHPGVRPLHKAATIVARSALVAAVALTLAASTGCQSDHALEAEINRLAANRSSLLGRQALAPVERYDDPKSYDRADMDELDPETDNPDAEELLFPVSRSDADVAQTLDRYKSLDAGSTLQIDLQEALRIAQRNSREYLTAEEEYTLSSIGLLIERHQWGPRFFATSTLNVSGEANGDSDIPLNIINELLVTKRLQSGGQVEARLVWNATEQLRTSATEDYVQSSALVLSGDIPLLRGAGPSARESLIQAERDLVYAARNYERFRRSFLVRVAQDYFSLVNQQNRIANTENSIGNLDLSYDRTTALVDAGRRRQFEVQQVEASILQRQADLINQRESYVVALDRFKIRLGIPMSTSIEIVDSELDLPVPDVTPAQASTLALDYRLDLQNRRDQLNDFRRAVRNRRNDLLPDLDLNASVTLPTDDTVNVGGFEYDASDTMYNAGVTFGFPLDRKIERLNLRSALIAINRALRDFEEFRDNVILDARQARRAIDQQRLNYQLAVQQVTNNRLTVQEFELREGETDIFDLIQAQDNLLQAENDRDVAEQSLQVSVLQYLLTTGQLRVNHDGTLYRRNIPKSDPTETPENQPAPAP